LVGLVHQQYDLVPHLPVIHNVLAGRLGQWSLVHSILSLVWAQDRQLALDVLGQLGIADKINERTSHLSGGEQQRVAIARLMMQSPWLVLADEPVASLDPARAEEMLALLTGLAATGGQALIVSLHSPYLIRKYCSRVIGLNRGQLEFDAPTSPATEDLLERLYDMVQLAPEVIAEAP
jgi:phosphonate transport system ATP-binding protein